MEKDMRFNDEASVVLEQLKKGAFLVVKADNRINPMTIAWGSIGFMWSKPVFMVMVRYSRYTYELMEWASGFTVSVPLNGQLEKALVLCGTKSGRDIDKAAASGLTLKQGSQSGFYYIDECDINYECKAIYQQAMEPGTLNSTVKQQQYSNHDFHVLYYGEIIRTFRNDHQEASR
jgi:flavin reductase (DIM6/NTAB) family NADH-FMN oxidoreductase RutF